MSGERKRIEDIKKRKQQREKELKKKIFVIRRVFLVLVALGIILAIVFGIKSCVNSVQQKKLEEAARIAAEEAAKPTPTPEPVIDANGIDQTFYSNSAFVGNSFVEGMTIYELLQDCDYFSKVGLTVNQVMTESTATGSVPIVEELNGDKKYSKIFLMFGENELGWIGDAFFEQYQTFLDKVKEYQPQASIYIISLSPVSQKISEKDVENLTIDSINTYNQKLKDLATNNNINFSDIFTSLVGTDGYLPDDAATDGVHFAEDYYIKMLKSIQTNQ